MSHKTALDICHARWGILSSRSEISSGEIPAFRIPEPLRSTCSVQGDVIGTGKATRNMILPLFSSGSCSFGEAKRKDGESKMPAQPNRRPHRLNRSTSKGVAPHAERRQEDPCLGVTWGNLVGQAFCSESIVQSKKCHLGLTF